MSWLIVERDNPFMENIMNEAVVDICRTSNYDKKKKEDHEDKMSAKCDGTDRSCDCAATILVWIDPTRSGCITTRTNTDTPSISKTRRVGYRHMFRVVNGGPEKKS
jgi:hypothetical protein